MSYVVTDSLSMGSTVPREPYTRWVVRDPENNGIVARWATKGAATKHRDQLNSAGKADDSARSELIAWQQDVLIPALLAKEEEHDWCDEFEDFLEDIGLERPKAPLPTGTYASVLLKGGDWDGYLAVRMGDDNWSITEAYESTDDSYVNRYYDCTVFAGQS